MVDGFSLSVLGADFIDNHHKDSLNIKQHCLWLHSINVPMVAHKKCKDILLENFAPVITRCTVQLPARHKTIVKMMYKDSINRDELWEATTTPEDAFLENNGQYF